MQKVNPIAWYLKSVLMVSKKENLSFSMVAR